MTNREMRKRGESTSRSKKTDSTSRERREPVGEDEKPVGIKEIWSQMVFGRQSRL